MYEFYLDGVRLPVTPGEITMSNGANIDVVDLANGQKITRWVGRDLETITFKASFPSTRYASFVDSGLKQPSYYIDKFMGLMRSGTPFQFVMFDSEVYNPFYNALSETPKSSSNKAFVKTMYIQSLQRTESAENGSEVEMEFTLLEWVEKETQTYTVYGKSIDISVNENEDFSNSNFAEEFEVFGDTVDFLNDAMEFVERKERPNPLIYGNVPEYHIVFDEDRIPTDYERIMGQQPPPTKEEFESMSQKRKINAGFTLNLISLKYYGTMDYARSIRELNPKLRNKGFNEILDPHTEVKLPNPSLDPSIGEDLLQFIKK